MALSRFSGDGGKWGVVSGLLTGKTLTLALALRVQWTLPRLPLCASTIHCCFTRNSYAQTIDHSSADFLLRVSVPFPPINFPLFFFHFAYPEIIYSFIFSFQAIPSYLRILFLYRYSVRLNIRITVTKVRFFFFSFSFRRYNSDKVSFASVLVILFLRLNKYDSYNNWSLETHKCPSLPSLRVLKKPGQLKQREVIDSISLRFMSSQVPHLQRKFPFELRTRLIPFPL